MGRGVVRIEHDGRAWFMEWSTVVDAPVTYGMNESEFRRHIEAEYGRRGLEDLGPRLARARLDGHSFMDDTSGCVEEFVRGNRAGPGESELSVAEIVDWYCIRQEDPHVNKSLDLAHSSEDSCEDTGS